MWLWLVGEVEAELLRLVALGERLRMASALVAQLQAGGAPAVVEQPQPRQVPVTWAMVEAD